MIGNWLERFLEQERWPEAVSAFSEIIDLQPDLDLAHYYLGTAYERQSEWEQALEAFLAIGRESALYDDAVSHIGYIYLETGRLNEAIDLLEARMAEGRPRAQVFNYLTSLYMANSQHEKALSTVEKGVNIYPEHVDLLYQRSLLLERLGRSADAMQSMKDLLAVDDEHAEAMNFIAYALAVENRDLDEALFYAESAVSLKPAPHILDTLGWVYYRMGRLIEALKVTEEASRQLSEDAVIFEHLGDIHHALNNLVQARASFEKALQLSPENLVVRDKLEKLTDAM